MAGLVEGRVLSQLLEGITASGHLQSLHNLLQDLGGDEFGLPSPLQLQLVAVSLIGVEHFVQSMVDLLNSNCRFVAFG